ncbi:MAG: Mur ligase domain-containing protein, partial [Vicinamibacterales bacterium]
MTWTELTATLTAHGLLVEDGVTVSGVTPPSVTGVAYDSRRVTTGQVFVALRGLKSDGTAFARQALERDAALVVADQPAPEGLHQRWVQVSDGRLALALLADRFFGHPS